jgi:transport and Golgi organization protein 2
MEIGVRDGCKQQGERACALFTCDALAKLAAIFGRCDIVFAGGLMCTISFLPRPEGFYLAMNRDEKRDRLAGLAPTVVELESHRAVFPSEPTGGTWISANDTGICLALINWHRIEREPKEGILSRGKVVRELAGKSTVDELAAAVNQLPIRRLRPFRLIAIVPGERHVVEWRWNLQRLAIRKHEWRRQHWFSSGFEERRAEVERQRVCDAASNEQSVESLSWLRRLHRSHAPKQGPFAICMHRSDAATVSYTEISVTQNSASMRYASGPPCIARFTVTRKLPIA